MVNNSLFKLSEIPKFHPISQRYERKAFWDEQRRYIIEGYWVGGKWMPPELYYYINFHHITLEKGIYRGISLPWLRDIDWEKAYLYSEAIGFSGFENDTELSCNRLLIDNRYNDNDLLRICTAQNVVDQKYYNNLFKSDGSRKTYVPARDYIQRIFKANMGKPLYYNSAKHFIELAARGLGKSFWASGLIAHNFNTGGAKDYDMYLQLLKENNPLKTETVVGAIDTKYSSKLMDKVKTGLDKLPGRESIRVDNETIVYPSPLALTCDGSFAVGKVYRAIYTGSQIQHVTFADNPLAANGGRPNRIFLDEIGFQGNILETWEAIESTQANEAFKRLTIYGMGTGGLTSAGAVTYMQEIFYNPEAYNCLAFEDTWEHKGKICYFISTLKSNNDYKEGPNLISNEERALQDVLKERELAKKARSKKKLLGLIINKPLVPSEIFLRSEGTFFPIEDLKQALGELETNKVLLSSSWKVDLLLDSTGKVITKPSNKLPIRDYPLTGAVDMDACIEIFEKPKSGESSEIISGRYFIVTDPVDNDGNDDIKRSLQSSFVYDAWVDRIVAEYTARTYLASQYYENVRRLALYYNAKILYENNKKGLFAHFKNKGSVSMLLETPKLIKDQTKDKDISVGNKMYGVNMNTDILKLHAIELLKEWLVKQAYNENDGVMNLQRLRSVALIKELIAYTMDLNADRVSALLMLMILLEDKQRIIESNKKLGTTNTEEVKKDDDFWKRAYNGRRLNVYSGLNSFYH